MIRLCHVITTLDPGGAENALWDLAVGLKNKNFEQDIVFLKGDGKLKTQFEQFGISVKKINLEEGISKAKALLKSHCQNRDLIHSHLLKANAISSMSCGNTPHVGSRHNDEKILDFFLVRWAHIILSRKEQKHIAISNAVKDFYVKKGLSAKKFNVIPYGYCAPETVKEKDVRKEFSVPHNHKLLLHAGRLVKQKGQRDLLQAMADIDQCSLILCGQGPLEKQLKNQAQQLKIDDRVHFCGFRNDMLSLMKGADLFVLPSHWEGLGRVLLECMAVGLPVVASNTSAIPEILGDCGWLCPPKQPHQLANTIKKALNEKEHWSRKIKSMKWRLDTEFSMGKMIDAHCQLYSEIIDA